MERFVVVREAMYGFEQSVRVFLRWHHAPSVIGTVVQPEAEEGKTKKAQKSTAGVVSIPHRVL